MGGVDLTASEILLIIAAAVVSGTAVRALVHRRLARDGRLTHRVLLGLERAVRTGPPPTADELSASSAVHSTARVRRAVALLEATGLLAGDDARIVATEEHLWVERRLHLTPVGAAAAEALRAPGARGFGGAPVIGEETADRLCRTRERGRG